MRDVRYSQALGRVASLVTNGSVHLWDPHLRLASTVRSRCGYKECHPDPTVRTCCTTSAGSGWELALRLGLGLQPAVTWFSLSSPFLHHPGAGDAESRAAAARGACSWRNRAEAEALLPCLRC